jgi:hypothetical protein
MNNSLWVTLHFLWNVVSWYLFLWPIACEWNCTFVKAVISHFFLWPTGSEWHWTFVKGSSSHFFSDHREWVTLCILWKTTSPPFLLWSTGSKWYCKFVKGNLTTFFPYDQHQQLVSDIGNCTFCEQQSYQSFPMTNRKWVTRLAHFVKGSLTTLFSMTNRLWEKLYILWKAVSSLFFSMTNRK